MIYLPPDVVKRLISVVSNAHIQNQNSRELIENGRVASALSPTLNCETPIPDYTKKHKRCQDLRNEYLKAMLILTFF